MEPQEPIKQTIRAIRPSLKVAAPWTFNTILAYGIFNLILGLGLYFLIPIYHFNVTLIGIIDIHSWGLIFTAQGMFMLLSLAFNHWKYLKFSLLTGIAIKTIWLLEIIVAAVRSGSPFIIFLWSLILVVQINTYIYFTPTVQGAERD